MCNFRVGQKVVCVDASRRGQLPAPCLVVGNIYTICGFAPDGGLRLVEAKPPKRWDENGYGFKADRFRHVVERKTDIEIFRRMLNTTPETVGAA